MPTQTEKPAAFVALDELAKDVHSPEDAATLKEWGQQISQERLEALHQTGATAVRFVEVGGVVEEAEAVEVARRDGQEVTGAGYDDGRRA